MNKTEFLDFTKVDGIEFPKLENFGEVDDDS